MILLLGSITDLGYGWLEVGSLSVLRMMGGCFGVREEEG